MATSLPGRADAVVTRSADSSAARYRRRLSLLTIILAALGVALGSGGAGASLRRAADVHTTITIGGSSVTVTLGSGAKAYLTFSGRSGQNLGSGLTGSSIACCAATVKLLNPSGTQIGSVAFSTAPTDWNLPRLTTTGTYTLVVDPGTKTGSVTLTLSRDIVGGSIAVDGASVTAMIARAGQNERFTFSATSGQYLGLGLTGSSLACCSNQVKLLDPSGTQIGSINTFGTSPADWNLPLLSTTGTYTLLVDPATNTGSVTLTLSDDLVQPLGIGGSPASLTLRVGQDARFIFTGSSGQTFSFSLSNNSIPFFQVMLLNSGGTQVGGAGFLGPGSVTWAVPTLPASGNYSIFFEPYTSAGTATFSLTLAGVPVNLSSPAISGILEDGEIVTASPGAWANAPTSFAYQWQRCIDGTCSDIADSAANTYTLADDDINSTVRVSVTASNLSGSTVVPSPVTGHIRIPHYSHSTDSCGDIEDPVNFLVDYPRVMRKHFVPGGALETEDYTAGRTGGQAAVTIADGHWHIEVGGSNDSWYDFGANGGCVNQNVFATSSPLLGEGHHVRFWISTQGRRPVGAAHHDFPCGQTGGHSSDQWIESAQDLANYFYNFEDLNGYRPLPVWAVYHDRPFTVTDKCNVEVPDDGITQELDFRNSSVLTIFDNWYFG